MKITITAISERQRARIKSKNNCETFLYTKIRTLFKKQDNFRYTFIYKKARHFTLRDFLWKFWSWHLDTKSMTLCVTWRFYIQKARYFGKSKTICVIIFIGFFNFVFIEFLKLVEGGGHFNMQKKCTLRYICIFKKQWNLRYVFIYKKPHTLCYIL